MEYKYCYKNNFEYLSCGRVIYHKAGMTNFPVRLAQEIYGRCLNYLDNKNDICIYDPCCGGGYLLTVLGLLNNNSIQKIIGSDIDNEAIDLARHNLSLLTEEGLEDRGMQLKKLYTKFHKTSHKVAIESTEQIKNLVKEFPIKPFTSVFQANIFSKDVLEDQGFKADIIITDVPYGNLVSWQGLDENVTDVLLDNLAPILKPNSVVAICSDKKQKIKSCKYQRLEKQMIGKRKFEILSLIIE